MNRETIERNQIENKKVGKISTVPDIRYESLDEGNFVKNNNVKTVYTTIQDYVSTYNFITFVGWI